MIQYICFKLYYTFNGPAGALSLCVYVHTGMVDSFNVYLPITTALTTFFMCIRVILHVLPPKVFFGLIERCVFPLFKQAISFF